MIKDQNSKSNSLVEITKIPLQKPAAKFGCRHVQILLLTGGFMCCYVTRVTMSVALVAMVDPKSTNHETEIAVFDWNESIQGFVLSSFFFGYVMTQIPGGMISQRWGAHKILAFAVGSSGLLTLIIPLVASLGSWKAVCACRLLTGFCQGVVAPSLHTMLSKWAPIQEKAVLTSSVFMGSYIGNVISLQGSGLIAASKFGWPGCFYFWGSVAVAWAIIWIIFGKESPAEHPRIPQDEKEYIETSLGVKKVKEHVPIPWRSMLSSTSVWAIWAAMACEIWGVTVFLTKIPAYLNYILDFDIKKNGLLSSLAYLSAWIFSFPASYFVDYSVRKKLLSVRMSRVLANTFGLLCPAVLLISLSYVSKEQRGLGVVLLVLTLTTNVIVICVHNVNIMDLAPNFAGPLMGTGNSLGNFCGAISPIVLGFIVSDPYDPSQWRIIFFLTAGINCFGVLMFAIFGSVKVQSWNNPTHDDETTDTKS